MPRNRSGVVFALLLLIVAPALPGCMRNLRAEEAYLKTLKEDFEAHRFKMSLPEAKLRILSLAQSGREKVCAPCVFADACDGKSCRFRFGSSVNDEACLLAEEAEYGKVGFKVTCGDTWRVEQTIRSVWEELEPQTMEPTEARAQAALAQTTLDEAQTFTPRWGLSGGAYGAFGFGHIGIGGRLGVRRWHDPNFLYGALLDYEWTGYNIPPAPIAQRNAGHLVSGLLRAEVAPWSAWSAQTSVPNLSLYMLAGGTWALDDNAFPGGGYGWRFGLGGHLNKYTRSWSLPVFVELHLARLFFRQFEVTNARVAVGLGF